MRTAFDQFQGAIQSSGSTRLGSIYADDKLHHCSLNAAFVRTDGAFGLQLEVSHG